MAHDVACGSGQVAETIGSSVYGVELRDWLQSHAIMCFVLRAEVTPYRGTAVGTDSRPADLICVQCSNSCVRSK